MLAIVSSPDKGFCCRGDLCPYNHGVDAVVVDERGGMSRPGTTAFHSHRRGILPGQQMPPQPPHPIMALPGMKYSV